MQASNHFCLLYLSPAFLSPIDFCTSDLNENPSGSASKGLDVMNVLSDVRHYHIAATVSYLSGKSKIEKVQSSPMALHVDQTYIVCGKMLL